MKPASKVTVAPFRRCLLVKAPFGVKSPFGLLG